MIVNLNIDDIRVNIKNHIYKNEDIEFLAMSIENVGLLEKLVVYKAENDEYYLISGHRRLLALKMLVNRNLSHFQFVDCELIEVFDDNYETELLLSYNVKRNLSPKEKEKIFMCALRLYENLVDDNKRPKEGKRDWLMSVTGLSQRSVRAFLYGEKKTNEEIKPNLSKKDKVTLKYQKLFAKLNVEELEMIKDVLEHAIVSSQEKEETVSAVNDISTPHSDNEIIHVYDDEEEDDDVETVVYDEPRQITDEELDALFDKI